MQEIDRNTAQRMLQSEQKVHLVEVLNESEFEEAHLPGAINVPLGDDFDRAVQVAVPNKSDPVIVYCKNTECQASPKAARRMDELGYSRVYDYAAGKQDWRKAGLPMAGSSSQ